MIKLLVTDIDGTILDNNFNFPSLNKKALIACRNRGIGVILATGKSIHSILQIVNLLDLKLPQITVGGSTMITKDLEIVNSIKIDPKYYLEAVKIIKENGYSSLTTLEDNTIYFEKYHPTMKFIKKAGEKIIEVDDIETENFSKNAACISIPIKETNPLDNYLRKKFSDKLQVVRAWEYFLTILNLNASKGKALSSVIESLNIKKEEVVVFGDNCNDLSMFSEAGLKIAVKNSHPQVLEEADIITDENYNCGVGKAIYKYILN